MGEFGGVSHGGTWRDAPARVRKCGRKHGFQPEPVEDDSAKLCALPDEEREPVPVPICNPHPFPVPLPGIRPEEVVGGLALLGAGYMLLEYWNDSGGGGGGNMCFELIQLEELIN